MKRFAAPARATRVGALLDVTRTGRRRRVRHEALRGAGQRNSRRRSGLRHGPHPCGPTSLAQRHSELSARIRARERNAIHGVKNPAHPCAGEDSRRSHSGGAGCQISVSLRSLPATARRSAGAGPSVARLLVPASSPPTPVRRHPWRRPSPRQAKPKFLERPPGRPPPARQRPANFPERSGPAPAPRANASPSRRAARSRPVSVPRPGVAAAAAALGARRRRPGRGDPARGGCPARVRTSRGAGLKRAGGGRPSGLRNPERASLREERARHPCRAEPRKPRQSGLFQMC